MDAYGASRIFVSVASVAFLTEGLQHALVVLMLAVQSFSQLKSFSAPSGTKRKSSKRGRVRTDLALELVLFHVDYYTIFADGQPGGVTT